MIFRQLFDPETSTYTYLLAHEETRRAVLIDTVLERFERDQALLRELDLILCCTLETHVHADHVTAAGLFRKEFGSQVVTGAKAGVHNADIELQDGESMDFGGHSLETMLTPGHTFGCVTYVHREAGIAFTGDALLIRGCGRTDFQQGDAATLFGSVREKIFSLPEETLLYPGHDYNGCTVTTISEEKRFNPRLSLEKSEGEFVAMMEALDLAYPTRIEVAVPANLQSGMLEAANTESDPRRAKLGSKTGSVAAVMETLGRQDTDSWMGMGI